LFEEPYRPPVSDGSGKDRKLLQAADKLLKEAGWQIKDGKRVNAKGEVLDLEFLFRGDPTTERILTGYVENLSRLGLAVSLRRVDPAQYERRVKTRDYDVILARFTLRSTPGVEMRNFWSSEAAKTNGSFNLAGISHPAVDALIVKAIEARSREELNTAMRALDRVLRAGHYWVSNWYKPEHHIAYWDKYSRPAKTPLYSTGLDSWWYDPAKAARLKHN
jgi:microcin C transport system substrate-binding protein